MTTDLNALEKQGWLRRFTASEPRLSEAIQTYRELGLEVLLVPILDFCKSEGNNDDGKTSCTACFEADGDPGKHKVIFTRPLKDGGKNGGKDDKLF